jgi:hypothetical protein
MPDSNREAQAAIDGLLKALEAARARGDAAAVAEYERRIAILREKMKDV